MALTAITGGESAHSRKNYPVKGKKEGSDTLASETKKQRKREDVVELKKEVTRANQSAQKSAAPGAEQLLGKIDLSA